MRHARLLVLALFALAYRRVAAATFKLGYIYPFRPSGWTVESFSQFRLAIQQINANPDTLVNHTLSFVAADTERRAATALQCAMDTLADPDVIGLCGTAYSSALPPAAMYASILQKPIVSPGSTAPDLVDKARFPFAVRTVASVRDRIIGLVAIVHDLGWRYVAAVGTSNPYGEAALDLLREECDAAGIIIQYYARHEAFPPSTASLAGVMQAVKTSRARVIFVLSCPSELDVVVPAMAENGLLASGYAVFVPDSDNWADIARYPGVVYISKVIPESPQRTAFLDAWPAVSTVYNATLHGAWDDQTKEPFYDRASPHIWAIGGGGSPSGWGMLMYDLVWVYALALHNLTKHGIDPHDGSALKRQLLATDYEGVTGPIRIDPDSQDRYAELTLMNVHGTASTHSLAAVEVGQVPRALGELSGRGWLNPGAQLQWPGGRRTLPVDGVAVKEVTQAVLLSFTSSGRRSPFAEKLFCAARLAEQHLNSRNGTVVDVLSSAADDIRFRLLPFDTAGDPTRGVQVLEEAIAADAAAVIGPIRSSVSVPIAARASGIPQLSPTASSDALSNKALFPGFGRTHPTDSQVASALVEAIQINFWTWTSIGVLYVLDSYGTSFLGGIRAAARATNGQMRVAISESFAPGDQLSMLRAVQLLRASQVSIFVCISHPSDLPVLLAAADSEGLLGEHFGWVLVDAVGGVDSAHSDEAFARRLHGMLAFAYAPSTASSFERLARVWATMSPADCSNKLFNAQPDFFDEPPPPHAALIYDAVATMGLAIGDPAVDDPFQHGQVVSALKGTLFEGSSGDLTIEDDGDRAPLGARFAIDNFVYTGHGSSDSSGDASSKHSFEATRVIIFTTRPDDNSTEQADRSLPHPNGQSGCPCLQDWPRPPPKTPDGSLIVHIDGTLYEYPPDYGIGGCKAHDMGLEPSCTGTNPKGWCSNTWCYVDPAKCDAPNSLSIYVDVSPAPPLYYSHITCTTQEVLADITWTGGVGKMPIDLLALGCPAGFEPSNNLVGRECSECSEGMYKAIRAPRVCDPCPKGSIQPAIGQRECLPCTRGSFQPDVGEKVCQICPPTETSVEGSTSCSCQPNFYRPAVGMLCAECPSLTQCGFGTTLATLRLRRGYYRLTNRTLDVHECYAASREHIFNACLGGSTADEPGGSTIDGGRQLSSGVNASASNASGFGYCADGHYGPICQLCADEQMYFSKASGRCEDCDSASRNGAILIAGVVAFCAAALLLVGRGKWAQALQFLRRWMTIVQLFGVQVKIKQAIGFYQVLTVVSSVYVVTMPREYVSYMQAFSWMSFDLSGFVLPTDCLGTYTDTVLVQVIWPPFLLALATAGVYLLCALPWCRQGQAVPRAWLLQEALPQFSLLLLFCVVPSVCATVFQAFQCTTFGYDDATGEKHRFLTADYRIRCPDDSQEPTDAFDTLEAIAIAGVVLWAVGVPALFLYLTLRSQRSGDMRFRRSVGFLTLDYKGAFHWWEPLEMCRKLALTGYVLLIPEDHSFLRTLFALILSLVFLVALFAAQPFKTSGDNAIAGIAQALTTCCLIAVTGMKLCREEADAACHALGVSPFTFSYIIIIVSLGPPIFIVGQLAHSLSKEQKGFVHLWNSKRQAKLSMPRGLDYHVFVSHTWSTGQDQAAIIKRQLQLILPGIRCFLDVDDLVDVRRLDEYVAKSALILMFASRGYFVSKACQIEVKAVLRWRKPSMFVHEADEAKGGGAWETVLADCPEEMEVQKVPEEYLESEGQPDIARCVATGYFEEILAGPNGGQCSLETVQVRSALTRPQVEVVRWHRIREYQVRSLERICAHLLRACEPAAVKRLSRPMEPPIECYIPGAVTQHELKLSRRIVFFCSAANTGAAEVARRLIRAWEVHAQSVQQRDKMMHQQPSSGRASGRRLSIGASADSPVRKLARSFTKAAIRTGKDNECRTSPVPSMRKRRSSRSNSVCPQVTSTPTMEMQALLVQPPVPGPEVQEASGAAPAPSSAATHMLLLLQRDTFVGPLGDAVAEEVRAALACGLPIVLLHDCSSCPFDRLLSTTPEDLVRDLYKTVALGLHHGVHEQVSALLLLKKAHADLMDLGEVPWWSRSRSNSWRPQRSNSALLRRRSVVVASRWTKARQGSVIGSQRESSAPSVKAVAVEAKEAASVEQAASLGKAIRQESSAWIV